MTVLEFNFLSKYLGYQTNVTICLPRPHEDDGADFYRPGMQFQTLYLLHGYSGDATDYRDFTGIVRYADDARIAVVMPSAYNGFYTDNPKGPRYWRFVSEELPQVCQSLFPLSTKREDNFVAGLSMGGHGAMKMGIIEAGVLQRRALHVRRVRRPGQDQGSCEASSRASARGRRPANGGLRNPIWESRPV